MKSHKLEMNCQITLGLLWKGDQHHLWSVKARLDLKLNFLGLWNTIGNILKVYLAGGMAIGSTVLLKFCSLYKLLSVRND